MKKPKPLAIVAGAERTFGVEIIEHLESEGYRVMALPFAFSQLENNEDEKAEVLVVNAPVILPNVSFEDISDKDFDEAMEDILLGVVRIVQRVLPVLQRGSRIVTVGSKGHLGAWGGAHVMAASAGLVAMTRSMALELLREGMSANHVAAGFAGSAWDTPLARAQVAQTALMLSAPDNGLVGESIIVDGGQSLRMSESRGR